MKKCLWAGEPRRFNQHCRRAHNTVKSEVVANHSATVLKVGRRQRSVIRKHEVEKRLVLTDKVSSYKWFFALLFLNNREDIFTLITLMIKYVQTEVSLFPACLLD